MQGGRSSRDKQGPGPVTASDIQVDDTVEVLNPEQPICTLGKEGRFRADVVVIAARPAQMMMVYEAALRSGVGNIATPALGRPGCAVLPMALNTGASALSFGCKGNRTFSGLPDEEMYLAIPGTKWEAVVEALLTIAAANATMEAHYKQHEATVRG